MSRPDRIALLILVSLAIPTTSRLCHRATASEFDPCSLLTAEEVAATTKAPSVTATRLDEKQCRYQDPNELMNQITVQASSHGAATYFAGMDLASRLLASSFGTSGTSPGPKVGDASTFWSVGQMFTARRGDAYVTIDMRGSNGDNESVGPALAAKVLERMH